MADINQADIIKFYLVDNNFSIYNFLVNLQIYFLILMDQYLPILIKMY